MRHFPQLDASATAALFHVPPTPFTRQLPAETLAVALGATLYSPAVRPSLADDIVRCHADGVMSLICCLEDAVRDDEVAAAERNLVSQLHRLAASGAEYPLLFVRVRTAEQIHRIADGLGPLLGMLTGFVLPKFLADDPSVASLAAIGEVADAAGIRLYALPILENPEVAHVERRLGALLEIRDLLHRHRERILAVRVGVTDLSGVYGLRRPSDLTAWDLGVVAGVLTDIVNIFARLDGTGFVVTGPVWEYFSGGARNVGDGARLTAIDGLVREVRLDMANGLTGKTVIHPSHATVVHALAVVGHEEYCDATAICASGSGGGVLRSRYGNKMNEVRPHLAWARRILRRAAVFGVAAEGVTFFDLLDACTAREVLV